MMWFLVVTFVINGIVVQAGLGDSPFETREECAAALVAWEAAPNPPYITNWHSVCIPAHRDKPATQTGQEQVET